MEHVPHLEGPFPWRTAALAAALLALAELAALLAMAGTRLSTHPAAAPAPAAATTRALATRAREHPLRPRSRVSVLVLNGNGIAHAAGEEAAQLLRRGYRHSTPADAPSHDYARSLVLFRRGWEREAQRLAHDAGVSGVTPLDGRLQGTEAGRPLVLILGAN